MKKFMSVLAAAAILATPFAGMSTAQAASHAGAPMAQPSGTDRAPAAITPAKPKPKAKAKMKHKAKHRMVKKAV
ncbi:MAG: hypothetical protein H7224_07645 [Polaromonas sp.]|nr:hypothetical protein [Polaromonas sp.]